MWRTEK